MRTFSRGRCLGTKERGTLATNRKWKPYCVLSNGTQVEKPSGIDPMKWNKLFVPSTFYFLESSSRGRVPPTTGHRLERGCTRSKAFLSCGQQPRRPTAPFPLPPVDDIRATIHQISPSFVPSRFCLFLRNFRASVRREARVRNERNYRGYGRLCAIDVVPTALSAAAPRDWRGRRSCQTFSKERLCRHYSRTCFDNIRIYVYTVIDTGLPHLAQIIGVPLYDREFLLSHVYAFSFSFNFPRTRIKYRRSIGVEIESYLFRGTLRFFLLD